MSSFSRQNLQLLTVDQLKRLAKYYDLQFSSKIRKQELIDLISPEEEILPEMSARVRRIYEQRMRGEL